MSQTEEVNGGKVDVCIEFVLVCRVSMVASGLVSRGGGVEGGTWGELLERAGGVRVDAEECTRGLVDLCTLLGVEVGCPCGLWILCTPAEEVVGCPCGYSLMRIEGDDFT
ncbi:BnaA08g14750D [Brassica napus]|uniref:BnaA08g14750D protein n=2 Tax=Brassica TaxID=3705 RepID=A0A078GE66_BRANA|nr:BnaA08g14750D [Brassica napus]VDD05525.1 unnamed protein product [Brassica rapa]